MTIATNPGTGGPDLASVVASGEHHQQIQLTQGASGTPVAAGAPLFVRPGTFATQTKNTHETVISGTGGTQLAASNSTRVGLTLINRGTVNVAVVYHASTAGASFAAAIPRTILAPLEEWIMPGPLWLGAVYGIAESGACQVAVQDDSP